MMSAMNAPASSSAPQGNAYAMIRPARCRSGHGYRSASAILNLSGELFLKGNIVIDIRSLRQTRPRLNVNWSLLFQWCGQGPWGRRKPLSGSILGFLILPD
jgi:hypothetical protein